MPRLFCICGSALNLSVIPSPHCFSIIPDMVMDELKEKLEELIRDEGPTSDEKAKILHRQIFAPEDRRVFKSCSCFDCGRLYVFDNQLSDRVTTVLRIEKGTPIKPENS